MSNQQVQVQNQTHPSLFIASAPQTLHKEDIFNVIKSIKFGFVSNIELIPYKTPTGKYFNRVIIHFRNWFNNQQANSARNELLSGLDIKIFYNEPYFLKAIMYNNNKKLKPSSQKIQLQQSSKLNKCTQDVRCLDKELNTLIPSTKTTIAPRMSFPHKQTKENKSKPVKPIKKQTKEEIIKSTIFLTEKEKKEQLEQIEFHSHRNDTDHNNLNIQRDSMLSTTDLDNMEAEKMPELDYSKVTIRKPKRRLTSIKV
jgi:hypothetical protein